MKRLKRKLALEFSIIALLDVIFLVTVFCVVGLARAVILTGVAVMPPQVTRALELNVQDLSTVAIDAQGRLWVEGRAATGSEEVLKLLRDRHVGPSDTILINGDEACTLGVAIPLIHCLRSSGYANVFCRTTEKRMEKGT